METRKYNNTRQIVDYSHVVSLDGQYGIFCLPSSTIAICRQLLASRGLWRSTYSIAKINDYEYQVPDEGQMDIIRESVGEFLEETGGYEMTLCSDLITELQGLTSAVSALDLTCETTVQGGAGCGEGSSGANSSEEPDTTEIDDGINPPEGFDTYQEYVSYKCQVAEAIRQEVLSDMAYIGPLSVVGLGVAGLVATLLSPIPGDEIFGLFGFLLSLILQNLLAGAATEITNALGTYEQEFICGLYESADVAEAKSVFHSELNLGVVATGLIEFWITADSLNRLFEPGIVGDLGADCDTCGEPLFMLVLGSSSSELIPDSDIVITPEVVSTTYRAYIHVNPAFCSQRYNLQVVVNSAIPGGPGNGADYDWAVCPSFGTVTQPDVLAVGTYPNRMGMSQIDGDTFSLTVRFNTI